MWSARRIDEWEDAKAAEDDSKKLPEPLVLGAREVFPDLDDDVGLTELARRSRALALDASDFYGVGPQPVDFQYRDGRLSFPSDVTTETEANNVAVARVVERGRNGPAAIILPHWNAEPGAYHQFANALGKVGITTVELTLPYHGERNRDGAGTSDYFLSSNLGRTIRSVRQGVLETRRVIDWLTGRGHGTIFVMGASLGSCVAGVTAAHDKRVRGSVLLLTAGDFADVVWTGLATTHIREGLEGDIELSKLKDIWSPISLFPFIPRLARRSHRLMIVSARRDRVVLPHLTSEFVDELRAAHANLRWRMLRCGHYSLGVFPFSWMTFAIVVGFLHSRR
jgi:hypothetical protein